MSDFHDGRRPMSLRDARRGMDKLFKVATPTASLHRPLSTLGIGRKRKGKGKGKGRGK